VFALVYTDHLTPSAAVNFVVCFPWSIGNPILCCVFSLFWLFGALTFWLLETAGTVVGIFSFVTWGWVSWAMAAFISEFAAYTPSTKQEEVRSHSIKDAYTSNKQKSDKDVKKAFSATVKTGQVRKQASLLPSRGPKSSSAAPDDSAARSHPEQSATRGVQRTKSSWLGPKSPKVDHKCKRQQSSMTETSQEDIDALQRPDSQYTFEPFEGAVTLKAAGHAIMAAARVAPEEDLQFSETRAGGKRVGREAEIARKEAQLKEKREAAKAKRESKLDTDAAKGGDEPDPTDIEGLDH
jgi:hypothetical protein